MILNSTAMRIIRACLFLFLAVASFSIHAQDCIKPIYKITWNNVSQPNLSDGSITVYQIQSATHYELLFGNEEEFNFAEAVKFKAGEDKIEIKGLSNPAGTDTYKIRVYNGENCYRTDVVKLSQLYFAKDLENTAVELIQGVDNPSPKVDDVVTFTTLVQSKGTSKVENLEVKQFLTESLEVIYFYADKGTYSQYARTWNIGDLKGGQSIKLVIRARVKSTGLSYLTSYISGINKFSIIYGQSIPTQSSEYSIAATNCVSVPIQIKQNQIYSIRLPTYKGVTWYYKDLAGNFSEIDEFTNPSIAEVNKDSSLSIKQGGEYTFTKKVDECTFNSCCPVIVESCAGPPIIVDSVYCNKSVDSYNIVVRLQNDSWSVVEKVYYAIANISFPVLTNFLRRINALPLTSSSGYVTSLGNSVYKIENIPAFMPNVTLVSTDMTGQCRTVKVVNAPNCQQAIINEPQLAEATMYYLPGQTMPNLRVTNQPKGFKTLWFKDELGQNELDKGKSFVPEEPGKYYVAFKDKKTGALSQLTIATVRDMTEDQPGQFVDVVVCDCKNPNMIPTGKIEDYTVTKAYPNPANDILNIQYRVPEGSKTVSLFIFNINGRQMASYELDKNKTEVKVNVFDWTDGLYVYNIITDGEKRATQKVIVRH